MFIAALSVFLVEDLPLNSSLAVYDAFELKTITHVALPEARVFHSPKTRANQFAGAIRELKQFLALEHTAPTNAHLKFEEAIRVPQFFGFSCRESHATTCNTAVLLIGSPLYQDAREPGFSMVDGYFHRMDISRRQENNPFSDSPPNTAGVPSVAIHWLYFRDPWVSRFA